MTFNEVLSQTIAMLQQHGRVSYRALRRQFAISVKICTGSIPQPRPCWRGLVESLPTVRLLLLVNYRPEYRHGWGSKTLWRISACRWRSSAVADRTMRWNFF